MECPKCGHQQEAKDKCAACGVYFSKLSSDATARKSKRTGKSLATPEEPRIGIGALGITALFTALLVIGFMRTGKEPTESADRKVVTDVTVVLGDDSPLPAAPLSSTATPGDAAPGTGEPAPGENPLEVARSATVLIETGLGLGSGFIIDEQCHVVTNRHVVDMDGAQIANDLVEDPEARAAIAQARQALRRNIEEAESRLRYLRKQPATNVEQAALGLRLIEMRKQLEDPSLGLKNYVAKTVDKSARAGFTATLPDGSSYGSLYAKFSDEYDLALFTLPAKFCTPVQLGSSTKLAFGQRLYTIGNPSGMAYTLTSGVFSGERFSGETRYLQTDAPINPGNSGGPLLMEDGRVIGINSMVLRNTQGIGFALPIEAVFDAFPELGDPPDAAD